jgi:hypothetical protein
VTFRIKEPSKKKKRELILLNYCKFVNKKNSAFLPQTETSSRRDRYIYISDNHPATSISFSIVTANPPAKYESRQQTIQQHQDQSSWIKTHPAEKIKLNFKSKKQKKNICKTLIHGWIHH